MFSSHSCLRFWQFTFILALGTFCPVFPVSGEESATPGAGVGEGFQTGGEPAVGVVAAAIKGALLFTQPLH